MGCHGVRRPRKFCRAQQRSITRWPYRAVAVTGPHLERVRAPGVSLVTFGTGNLPGQWSVQRGEPASIRASATHREGNKTVCRTRSVPHTRRHDKDVSVIAWTEVRIGRSVSTAWYDVSDIPPALPVASCPPGDRRYQSPRS